MGFLRAILFLIKTFWHWSLIAGVVMFVILLLANVPTLDMWVYSTFTTIGIFLLLSVIFGNKKYKNRNK